MENKQADVLAILKLYELRRDEEMRRARQWYFTEFNPTSAGDIAKLVISGEKESAYYRAVTSYWNMACSFVLNGAIDEKLFADATPSISSCSPNCSRFWRNCASYSATRITTGIWNNS